MTLSDDRARTRSPMRRADNRRCAARLGPLHQELPAGEALSRCTCEKAVRVQLRCSEAVGGRRFTAIRGAGDGRRRMRVPGATSRVPEFEYSHPCRPPPQGGHRRCPDFLRGDQRRARVVGRPIWARHDSMADMTLMTARGNDVPRPALRRHPSTTGRRPPRPQSPPLPEAASAAACEQDTWAYLDGKCAPAERRHKTSKPGVLQRRPPRSQRAAVPAASRLPLATGANAAASPPEAVRADRSIEPCAEKARKTATRPDRNWCSDAGRGDSSSRRERGARRAVERSCLRLAPTATRPARTRTVLGLVTSIAPLLQKSLAIVDRHATTLHPARSPGATERAEMSEIVLAATAAIALTVGPRRERRISSSATSRGVSAAWRRSARRRGAW